MLGGRIHSCPGLKWPSNVSRLQVALSERTGFSRFVDALDFYTGKLTPAAAYPCLVTGSIRPPENGKFILVAFTFYS